MGAPSGIAVCGLVLGCFVSGPTSSTERLLIKSGTWRAVPGRPCTSWSSNFARPPDSNHDAGNRIVIVRRNERGRDQPAACGGRQVECCLAGRASRCLGFRLEGRPAAVGGEARCTASHGARRLDFLAETALFRTPRTAQRYMRPARSVSDPSLLGGLSLRQTYFRLGVATEPNRRAGQLDCALWRATRSWRRD